MSKDTSQLPVRIAALYKLIMMKIRTKTDRNSSAKLKQNRILTHPKKKLTVININPCIGLQI